MSKRDKDKTSYLIKNMDKDLWLEFRATAMRNGHWSARDCLIYLIERYNTGEIGG